MADTKTTHADLKRELETLESRETTLANEIRDIIGEENIAPDRGTEDFKNWERRTDMLNLMVRPEIMRTKQRIDSIEKALPETRPSVAPEVENLYNALDAWNNDGISGLVQDYSDYRGEVGNRGGVPSTIRDLSDSGFQVGWLELMNVLSSAVSEGATIGDPDGAGGKTVQTTVTGQVVERQKYFGGVMDVANCFYKEGGPIQLNRWDMTSRKSREIAAEGDAITSDDVEAFGALELKEFEMYDSTDITKTFFRRSQMSNPGRYILRALSTGLYRKINDFLTQSLADEKSSVRVKPYGLMKVAKASTETIKDDGSDLSAAKVVKFFLGEVDWGYIQFGNSTVMPLDVGYDGVMLESMGNPHQGPAFMLHQSVLAQLMSVEVGSSDKRLIFDPEMMTLPSGQRCYSYRGIPFVVNNDLHGLTNATTKATGDTSKSKEITAAGGAQPLGANAVRAWLFGDFSHFICRFSAPVTFVEFFDSGTWHKGNEKTYGVHTALDSNYGARNGSTDNCDAIANYTVVTTP